ncbi:hypothetical protein [Demequina sp. NBRC 110056]|uniref:hypothetical protein n=1 Tax=Demequina sp. NBRC 110056 TaxID=1570345 RepID=UPI0009FF7B95|nr:hypothetical protein [Demequina sp. NBRC 110056]
MKIRRAFAIGALAAVVAAVPTAASATYPDPNAAGTCSATQTVPEGTVTCTLASAGTEGYITVTTSGADASTTVAGTVTSATQSLASGSASWNVTAPNAEGTMGVSFFVDGAPVDTVTVVVAEELSATGFENMGLAVGAGALLVIGAGAVMIGARRRVSQGA